MASSFSSELQHLPIGRAVQFADLVRLSLARKMRIFLLWASSALAIVFLVAFFGEFLEQRPLSLLMGGAFLTGGLGTLFLLMELFGAHLKAPPIPKDSQNPAALLSFEAASALLHAAKRAESEGYDTIPPALVLFYLFKEQETWRAVLERALLSPRELLGRLERGGEKGEDARALLSSFVEHAAKQGKERVRAGDMLAVLAEKDPVFSEVLVEANLFAKDLELLASWLEWMEEQKSERGKFWRKRNLRARGTLGRNWTSGFALTLERFSQDISEEAKRAGFPEPARSRGKQLEALERVLARGNETNALLVGEEGVGKLELLRGLAGRSLLGETLPELRYLRVLELDLPSLLAQVPDPGAREGALDDIFGEVVKAGNVILVVNGLQQYVGDNEGRPGTVDLTGILTSYLRIPSFRFVGLTTYAGLHQRLEQYPAFLSLMGKIEVPELSEEDTLAMLLQRLPSFEVRYGIAVTYPALRSAVELAGQFIGEVPFPQKAISLLQEALTYAAQLKEPALLPSHVEKVISEKTEMPVGQLKQEEREKLLRLESLIHERLVDQEEAVSEIASSLRRARTQVSARKGPMGSFLFLGPTGVGKTEAAKTLASIYFGSESRMLRLDMSEFQSANDIPRLLGGRGEEGLLTTPVRENPFSLLLLDELEKAHSSVLNLFLQVLDEGHITDGLGRRVDFKNTIIIATSNAGYQIILEAIRTNKKFDTLRQEIFDHLFEKGIYRPEFLNRFTAVVIFKPLSPEDLLQIAGLMLAKVQKNLLKKGVEFVVTDALKEKIAELGYDPTFGARHMQRVIQEKVENALAQGFLEGKLERGTKVELNPEDFSLQVHS